MRDLHEFTRFSNENIAALHCWAITKMKGTGEAGGFVVWWGWITWLFALFNYDPKLNYFATW